MIPDVMKQKLLKIAETLGVSPETLKAIESEVKAGSGPAIQVAVVKKEVAPSEKPTDKMPELCDITDEQIAKMTEQEAKDCLKKYRDEELADEEEDDAEEKVKEDKPNLQEEMKRGMPSWY